jgi:gluconolactonase
VCNSGGFVWHEVDGKFSAGHKSADYSSGSIQRVRLETGEFSTLYTQCADRLMSGPNDIVFDRGGNFWFSDFGPSDENHKDHGSVYYAKSDGSQIRRSSRSKGCSARRMESGCQMKSARYSCRTPSLRAYGLSIWRVPGNPAGNVCLATVFNGGITLIREGGEQRHIPFPDSIVTNICFGGEDMRTAWVTGSDQGLLFRCRWPTAGQRLNFNA